MIETACDDDSACPTGWSCERYTNDVPCTAPPRAPDQDPGAGAEAPPTDCGDAAPPAPTQGFCVPPYSYTFDTGVPRDGSSTPQYEVGTATGEPLTPNTSGTPGNSQNDSGCGGGATSIGGLALMMVALWRRRTGFGARV